MSNFEKLYYKVCREKAGISQEKAAQFLGVDPVTLSRYENGHYPVPVETVAKMVVLYQEEDLAAWHVERANYPLMQYIRKSEKPLTDADAILQLEIIRDIAEREREAVKAIVTEKGASLSAAGIKTTADALRMSGDTLHAVADYLEARAAAV